MTRHSWAPLMTKHIATIEDKVLNLLGQGIPAETVASALGVSPGRISQLLSDDVFSQKVVELRYSSLQKHNARDEKYDSLEDRLLERLEKTLPLMMKPETILKAIATINGAKRRGQSTPESITNKTTVVNLILPTKITQKFSVNENNQVIKAGNLDLTTIQSGDLRAQIERKQSEQLEQLEDLRELEDLTNGGNNETNEGIIRKEATSSTG